MKPIHQILFIELLGGIGDVLIALPAIHALGRSYPSAHLTVLTFAPGGELLETDPLIDQVVYAPRGKARAAVEQLLTSQSFNLIVSDTNYDSIAELIQNYRLAADLPIAITNLWQSPPLDERVGDRFLHLLLTAEVITPEAAVENQSQLHLTQAELTEAKQVFGATYRPIVVLCPDAGMAIKRWDSANFITTGKALQQKYGATILVTVGADLEQATEIVDAIGGSTQLIPRGTLRQVAAILAHADLMIAADTGLARIAAALNVPTITLFGPSWYERYGQPSPHINLQGFPNCPERQIRNFTEQSCWYSGNCPFDWQTCLDEISPKTVLEAAETLLSKAPLPPLSTPLSFPSPWQQVQNLLVMRLDNIGDVIMTSPTLQALRQNLPTAKITLMTSPAGAATAPLLPWVDQVLSWRTLWQDLGRLAFDPEREWQLIEMLRQHGFDAAIILTSFSQSPHPAALICTLAGIPLRVGESKEQDYLLTDAIAPAPDYLHQVERNLRLIEAVGFQVESRRLVLHIPESARQTALQLPQRPGSPDDSPYILLNPWTSCPSRNYDPERFGIAARQLSRITGWPIVITGVERDRGQLPPLIEILGNRAIDLVGTTSLAELVALVDQAKLVLSNNTSLMHIADAVDTPSVILFAGTELESQWQPRHSAHRLLRRSTACSPCYAFKCAYQMQCLDISPDAVVAAGLELIQQESRHYECVSDLRQ
jgi:ADP-heptose:LPS heptosyltransferase